MEAAMFRTLTLVSTLLLAGCSTLGQLAWQAADQAGRYSAKNVVVPDIDVPPGFRAVRVVNGLNFPSAFTFDDAGNIYVLESHTVPVPMLHPKIVRVATDGSISRVALSGAEAPDGPTAIGLTFHDGWLYFSHEQKDGTFSIARVRPSGGPVEAVLRGIPVPGDHDVNHLLFDAQGNLYFGVGSATNSGVVAAGDPVNEKWLKLHPDAHDLPCRTLQLTGETFNDGKVTTGAYQPHGQAAARSVPAAPLCTSSVYRLKPGRSAPELVAWGFRNPVALAFDGDGTLLVGMQGADVRSTRPVKNDADSILRIREGAWYGWPDYSATLEPFTGTTYAASKPLTFIIDHTASGLAAPDRALLVAATKPHAAICSMVRVPDAGPFALWAGRILVAEMGDFKPMTDPNDSSHAGFQVEALDPRGGGLTPVLRNRGSGDAQPASTLDLRNGFERPVDVRIGPDGSVYVLDFGAFITAAGAPKAFPKTGKLFRIEAVK
jgi:glucose/arabinose dehydrogenase